MAMRIKPQGGILTIIRTEYSSEKKRGEDKTIGSIKADNPQLTDEISSKLSEEEAESVRTKLHVYQSKQAHAAHTERIKSGAGSIAAIAAAFDAKPGSINPEDAQNIWKSMALLAKSLRASGYKRPRVQKTEATPMPMKAAPAKHANR